VTGQRASTSPLKRGHELMAFLDESNALALK